MLVEKLNPIFVEVLQQDRTLFFFFVPYVNEIKSI